MKKTLLILFIAIASQSFGQTFTNSWIDYSKTYYKFPVVSTGLYRIPYSTLTAMGLGNTPAEQFQLWRNGEQVTLFTSVATGTMSSGDYIEFWGIKNDGATDTKLYRDTDYQLCNFYSLETDTATYFLTVNPSGNNLRYADAPNNIAGNSLPAEPYFMNSRSAFFHTQLNGGEGLNLGEYVYSSSYDIGEGWTCNDIAPGSTYALYYSFDTLNMYTGGPPASFYFAAAGNALNIRTISLRFFNKVIDSEALSNYTYVKKWITNLPDSDFPNTNQLAVSIVNNSAATTDRMVVAAMTLNYASTFNFNNQNSYYFQLPATSSGNYLVISNFNYGTQKPVLLDLSNHLRYTGDDSSLPGKVQFVLPPSSIPNRQFELVSEDPSAIRTINSLQQRNFINFALAANQGNYLIISNPALYDNGSGVNYVDQYRAYRSSTPGGSFDAKVYDIGQLTDQFAYGIKNHPGAIKDFIQYATNTFSPKPQYVFLIGKGITYDQYLRNKNSIYDDKLELVPSFGSPASDILLSSPYGSNVPNIPIGRLSAVSGNEVGNYLQKVKEYEQAQTSNVQTESQKLWMKNIVEVSGGSDSTETSLFNFYLGQYGNILKDTLFGGNVYSFSKTSNSGVQLLSNQQIKQLFDYGIGILSYFGHSSANQLAFNLSDPTTYNNQGRYPFFFVSGCTAGNNYAFDTTRITQNHLSISENFVLAPERGSIGFFASSHLGVPPYLYTYDINLYKQIGVSNYGNTIGNDIKNTILSLGGSNYAIDFLSRCNLEELNLHGDPAIRINPQPKPDYVIEDPDVLINPAFISIAQSSFKLQARAYNLGRAVKDSITFQVKRTYPNGTSEIIYSKRIRGIQYADSISISIPIVPSRDKGDNKITVTIDADNNVDEMSETNNSITKDVYIYEDEATPAYPYNYAIINIGNQKLYASTANPTSPAQDYVMEIDTTEKFNSTSLVTRTLNSPGGILEFDPGFTYVDSTVYYWRVALKPVSGLPSDYHWNTSSFIYLPNSSAGSNQSHYYQHLHSDTSRIRLDSASRSWKYDIVNNIINAKDGVFPTAASLATDFQCDVNGAAFAESVCGISGIIFNVLDPISLKPWKNVMGGTSGLYGSDPVCSSNRLANFQFNLLDSNKRKDAARFLLDTIPDNYIVIVRNISGTDSTTNTYASTWAADSSSLGYHNTLYYALQSQGFVLIDSFYRPRSFIFMYQKNNPAFNPEFVLSNGIYDKISLSHSFLAPDSLGYITSPVFGPAEQWKQMHWRGYSLESNSPDNPTVQIIGIDSAGNSSTLMTVDKTMQDVDLSTVNASKYPYIQLKMRDIDSIKLTPYQLSYWRLNYNPAPEGALAPNLFYTSMDTLKQGELLHFGVAFKDVSPQAFPDSMKVNVSVIDKNNVTHNLPLGSLKPLASGDTIALRYDIDTRPYTGANTLLVYFNPKYAQPEQYLFNNFIYQPFYVKVDQTNPLMDVTFDGVHILNRDIVSAKPHIMIGLQSQSQFLALTDTSLVNVQVQFPDGSLRAYRFDGDTLRFTPANLASGKNEATVDFYPSFLTQDGDYELIVSGKDAANNPAGQLNYKVDFRVINKPMISNMLNYPNPFTTSTAFVFTITGSQVPQNIRIQILTITGKIIKEITEDELGPLHIGTNITQYKWDGTDMYGQKVGNGVYLYRVLTNLNGQSLSKFTDSGDNTDKYFTKGYGKMYLMR